MKVLHRAAKNTDLKSADAEGVRTRLAHTTHRCTLARVY